MMHGAYKVKFMKILTLGAEFCADGRTDRQTDRRTDRHDEASGLLS